MEGMANMKKLSKKVLAILLTLTIVLPLLPSFSLPVFAAGGSFGGGDGSNSNPYIITDAADLDAVRNNLDASYRLAGDINLVEYLAPGGAGYAKWGNSGWDPIGTIVSDVGVYFTGTLDGAGYKIGGLWINRPSETNVGLFSGIQGATLKDINIVINTQGIVGGVSTGALVGIANDSAISSFTISGCSVAGIVTGRGYYTGGLIGLTGTNTHGGSISGCSSSATVTAGDYTGGVVGNANVPINFCYNTGYVYGKSSTGGVAGFTSNSVTNSYNMGEIFGNGWHVGGVVGTSHGVIDTCFNAGEVQGNLNVGGVAGTFYQMKYCYNTGRLEAHDSKNKYRIAGLAGANYSTDTSHTNSYLRYSYNAGIIDNSTNYNPLERDVENRKYVGHLVGYARNLDISYCYFVKQADVGYHTIPNATRNWAGNGTLNRTEAMAVYFAGVALGSSDMGFWWNDDYLNCNANEIHLRTIDEMTAADALTNSSKLSNLNREGGYNTTSGRLQLCCRQGDFFPELVAMNNPSRVTMATRNHSRLSVLARMYNGGSNPYGLLRDEQPIVLGSGWDTASPLSIGTERQFNHYRWHMEQCARLENGINLKTIRVYNPTTYRYDTTRFDPLGNAQNPYNSIFFGNGKTISELVVQNLGWYSGLFGVNKGIIEHLTVLGTVGNGSIYSGGIAGMNDGLLRNCHFYGDVWSYEHNTGGITGENNSEIIGCSNFGTVSGSFAIGGIAGNNTGTLTESMNVGTVYSGAQYASVGGIAGYNTGTISQNRNFGQVRDIGSWSNIGGVTGVNFGAVRGNQNAGSVNGTHIAGGIVGLNYSAVDANTNYGSINATSNVGGIVGENKNDNTYAIITNSTNNGYVYCGTREYSIGGIAGFNNGGWISGCANSGLVRNTATMNVQQGNTFVGGLVGYNLLSANGEGYLKESYNEGGVLGVRLTGGLAGWNNMTISECFNTGSISATNAMIGGLTGNNVGTIRNCYNTGEIIGPDYVGGISGFMYGGTLESCYNFGNVQQFVLISGPIENKLGGIVGGFDTGTVTNCWYDNQKVKYGGVNQLDRTGAAGLTTLQMTGSGAMSTMSLSSGFWQKRANNDGGILLPDFETTYYPELTYFAGSSSTIEKRTISRLSVMQLMVKYRPVLEIEAVSSEGSGGSVTIMVRLTGATSVANQPIILTIGSDTYNLTTDSNGLLMYPYSAVAVDVTAVYEGDAINARAEATLSFDYLKDTRVFSILGINEAGEAYFIFDQEFEHGPPIFSTLGDNIGVISWTSSNHRVATLTSLGNDTQINIAGAGETTITANIAANTDHNSASASFRLIVGRAQSDISFAVPNPPNMAYSPNFSYTNSVIGSVASEMRFSITSGTGMASIDETTGEITNIARIGDLNVTVFRQESDNYMAARADYVLNIVKATPTITDTPVSTPLHPGDQLSASALTGGVASAPGTFAWQNPDQVVAASGNYTVIFTPDNLDLYNTVVLQVPVTATDTSSLAQLVRTANQLMTSAVVGSNSGQYPSGAVTALNDAISHAGFIINDLYSLQTDINDAVSELEAAITDFPEQVNRLNYYELDNALLNVGFAMQNSSPGELQDNLLGTLESAWTARTSINATQSDVDDAAMAITAAIRAMNQPTASLSLSRASIAVDTSSTVTVSVPGVTLSESAEYNWSVSPISVAVVSDEYGRSAEITGVSAGQAVISCSIFDHDNGMFFVATTTINVTAPSGGAFNRSNDDGDSEIPESIPGSFNDGISEYTLGSDDGLVLTIDKDFSDFDRVMVGDADLVVMWTIPLRAAPR